MKIVKKIKINYTTRKKADFYFSINANMASSSSKFEIDYTQKQKRN